jgi:hypothetical protein
MVLKGNMAFHVVSRLGLFLAFAVVGFAYFRNRALLKRHGGQSRFRLRRGSAGNALHQLRSYVHPHAKFAIAQTQKDEVVENTSLDHQDPVAHLYSQAIRIQKGEEVDQITALVPDENGQCGSAKAT